MHKVPRSRRLITLVAAYAIALQALLLPLSVAAGAAVDFSLCTAASSAITPQPDSGHSTGCACAAGCGMQCCVQALAGPPHSIFVVVQTYAGTVTPPPVLASIARPYVRGPQLARAPPVA